MFSSCAPDISPNLLTSLLTPPDTQSLPTTHSLRDCHALLASETGNGKTLAMVAPMLQVAGTVVTLVTLVTVVTMLGVTVFMIAVIIDQ